MDSYWNRHPSPMALPMLEQTLEADVVIVGAGIVGLTAAFQLAQNGKRVVVLEKARLGQQDSGHTTAHLTSVFDTRYYTLVNRFGIEAAQLAAESSSFAIQLIERTVRSLGINCRFERVPGFLYSEDPQFLDEFAHEEKAASAAGLSVSRCKSVPLPFPVVGGLRFENQAQFDPTTYLLGLANSLTARGVRIYEDSPVVEIESGVSVTVSTQNGRVRAADLILATNHPIRFSPTLSPQLATYQSYAVAFALTADHRLPGLFWDTQVPYHSIRWSSEPGETGYLIVSGEDHEVSLAVDSDSRFKLLTKFCRSRFLVAQEHYRWCGQIIESSDGLPYIGNLPDNPNHWVATGFGGNGITSGTLAGAIIADEIQGYPSRWSELYSLARLRTTEKPKVSFNQ